MPLLLYSPFLHAFVFFLCRHFPHKPNTNSNFSARIFLYLILTPIRPLPAVFSNPIGHLPYSLPAFSGLPTPVKLDRANLNRIERSCTYSIEYWLWKHHSFPRRHDVRQPGRQIHFHSFIYSFIYKTTTTTTTSNALIIIINYLIKIGFLHKFPGIAKHVCNFCKYYWQSKSLEKSR